MSRTVEVSVKGRPVALPAIELCGVDVVCRGSILKTGEIFDEYWLERLSLPPINSVLIELRSRADRPDLFTFSQRVPDTKQQEAGLFTEYANYAVLPLSTYDEWFNNSIPSTTRRNIRTSEKRGITVRVCDFDDRYVNGISAIFNETPLRAGRKYWHFGKDIETVKKENGTYADRSTFLAAYHCAEMVGYVKVVWDRKTAAIMQILSRTTAREQRVNNALMAEVVRQACARGVEYLIYESFDYGNKKGDSLTRFKQSNGFQRMDVPRYYVPLTWKGNVALRLGLHKGARERVPEWLASRLRGLRGRWYERGAVAARA
jgi:Acetyltransferase (GNAT) domain